MGSKPLWLLPLRETLSSLHGTINKPLLCSWGACYVSMSRLWLYKYFWKHSPEQMQPVLIKCTEMWDPWRIFFQTYVVVIKRDRYEEQPKAIYAKVLMQRFKPPLVSSGILIFLTLATGPYQIYQSINLSKVWLALPSKYLSSLPFSLHYCLIQDIFISPLHAYDV